MEEIGRYFTLVFNVLMIFLFGLTFFITSQLLWLSRKLLFTPVFKIHLIFITVLCGICISNSCYVVVSWKAAVPSYYPLTLYIITTVSAGMLQANFISESFLCLDRCCIIAFPKFYSYKAKLVLGVFHILGLFAYLFYQFYIYGILRNIPFQVSSATELTICPHIQCLLNTSNSELLFLKGKLRWGLINLFLVIVLILLIKFKISMPDIKNKLHYAVVTALLFTLAFELVPNSVGVLINLITGKSMIVYAGPYSVTLSTVNIFICNYLYSRAILKRNAINQSSIVSQI